ncbi:hypothetical protein BC830DRAFT_1076353 [Chytriomyces sp. MP71]|nr:hypothetical protein BC830DRAFT_1076353 [Chytriomyces sp. MP71]
MCSKFPFLFLSKIDRNGGRFIVQPPAVAFIGFKAKIQHEFDQAVAFINQYPNHFPPKHVKKIKTSLKHIKKTFIDRNGTIATSKTKNIWDANIAPAYEGHFQCKVKFENQSQQMTISMRWFVFFIEAWPGFLFIMANFLFNSLTSPEQPEFSYFVMGSEKYKKRDGRCSIQPFRPRTRGSGFLLEKKGTWLSITPSGEIYTVVVTRMVPNYTERVQLQFENWKTVPLPVFAKVTQRQARKILDGDLIFRGTESVSGGSNGDCSEQEERY